MNPRACSCVWWKDPDEARRQFVAQLKDFPDCGHGVAGGDLKAPDGWQYCSMCRGRGWVAVNLKPRTEERAPTARRSTGVLRAEQGLRVAAKLDAEHNGAWIGPAGYHHLTDSRHPGRDYSEPL
jgi:hypothetical protein